MVLIREELLPGWSNHLCRFEDALLNHIEVVAFLSFSARQRPAGMGTMLLSTTQAKALLRLDNNASQMHTNA